MCIRDRVPAMLSKGKLGFLPERIKGRRDIRQIFKKTNKPKQDER